jgi:1-acyl-sn-glycerol-3-phosphate acyltransferase
MSVFSRTELPPSASLIQRILYPFVRHFFFFFFTYLPYAPIKRKNKPVLKGTFLWASSHSNYLCDTIPAAFEGPCPTKFLAKSTLFRFPLKKFLEFCGALPVARAEDLKGKHPKERSAQNRSTFRLAIEAMEQGWPVAIFPEGVSIVNSGLVLPLKPGIAKLGFLAEETNDFRLGLKIIPVGLEYGSRSKVGSGLTIHYGEPIVLSDFREKYQDEKESAVREVMEILTAQMLRNFPHFQNESRMVLAKKLVALGISPSKHAAAQLFLRKETDADFWLGLEARLRNFEQTNKAHGIPIPAWGHRLIWKELGAAKRRKRAFWLAVGVPVALFDLLNNSLPEFVLQSLVEQVAVDETEKMSLRFILSPFVIGTLLALQFRFLKTVVFERSFADFGWGAFAVYGLVSVTTWYLGVHWRRQFKRVASLFFFRWAGVDGRSQAMEQYRGLRQYLGEFEDHGGKRS